MLVYLSVEDVYVRGDVEKFNALQPPRGRGGATLWRCAGDAGIRNTLAHNKRIQFCEKLFALSLGTARV